MASFTDEEARLRICGAITPFPHMSSWHGTQLSTETILPLPHQVFT
jgi:hypothetical protein